MKPIKELSNLDHGYLVKLDKAQTQRACKDVSEWLQGEQNYQTGRFEAVRTQLGFSITRLVSNQFAGMEISLFGADQSAVLCYLVCIDFDSQELKLIRKHSAQEILLELELLVILQSVWVANRQNTQGSYSPSA